MILKSFKVKSNEKYLNKLLSTRQVKVGGNAVKSIGVILNKDAFSNVLEFKSLTKQIKLSSKALSLDLKIATARSKAQFKIGILQTDTRLNDLIIKTNINEFDVFKNEVFKYLTILNKI